MTARFALHLGPLGIDRLNVDGEDLTALAAGVHLEAAPNQPTVLTVHTVTGGVVEGDGIVQVVAADDRAALEAFFTAIDPKALEAEALMLCDASTSPTVALLSVLATWARGDT